MVVIDGTRRPSVVLVSFKYNVQHAMSRRTSSVAQPASRQRPSLAYAASTSFLSSQPLHHRLSTISSIEAGLDDTVARADDAIHEEIAEIKRYEVRSQSL